MSLRGFNVFVFDYRGYGASTAFPETIGVFADANSALNHVRMRADVDPEKFIVLGQSLGGTNALAVVGSSNRGGVKAVVIEATFFSCAAIAGWQLFGARLLMNGTYRAENYIAKIAPIPLLLHGTADPVIPLSHSTRLFEKAGEPKNLSRSNAADMSRHLHRVVG